MLIGVICIVIDIYSFVKNINNIDKKKFVPMLVLIVLMVFAVVIRNVEPGITVVNSAFAFVTIIMYFTIENPDMKLLEEVHRSKEISDSANEEKTLFLYNLTQEIRGITNTINDDANMILVSKDLDEI